MIDNLELITIQSIALLTFLIALITSHQAHRAWNWPWSLQIPEGANGRWKLDWGIALFLWGIGIDYQLQFFHRLIDPQESLAITAFHLLMMSTTILVFKALRHEYHERRKEKHHE